MFLHANALPEGTTSAEDGCPGRVRHRRGPHAAPRRSPCGCSTRRRRSSRAAASRAPQARRRDGRHRRGRHASCSTASPSGAAARALPGQEASVHGRRGAARPRRPAGRMTRAATTRSRSRSTPMLCSPRRRPRPRRARGAVAEPGTVGDHLGMVHGRRARRDALLRLPHRRAYHGWRWARQRRARAARQGRDRLRDQPASRAPTRCSSPRVAPVCRPAGARRPRRRRRPAVPRRRPATWAGFEATGDEDVDQMAVLRARSRPASGAVRRGPRGRPRSRWYDGDDGPTSDVPAKAHGPVLDVRVLPADGRRAARRSSGSAPTSGRPSDGQVVSLDHGCGAHSETDADPAEYAVGRPADRRRVRRRHPDLSRRG